MKKIIVLVLLITTITFINKAKAEVSKGAKPDYLRFGSIPESFKGAVLVPELKKEFEGFIKGGG